MVATGIAISNKEKTHEHDERREIPRTYIAKRRRKKGKETDHRVDVQCTALAQAKSGFL
jgi:hypothetical protein